MTIAEYNTYFRQHLQRLVEEYVTKKYVGDDYIRCFLNPFYVQTLKDENGVFKENDGYLHYYEPDLALLVPKDYCTLLYAVVQHPGLVFQELPFYIPIELYRQLVDALSCTNVLDAYEHPNLLDNCESSPVAVHMTTLLEDAAEIVGEDMCTSLIQTYRPYRNYTEASVHIEICIGLMEVYIDYENSGDMSKRIMNKRHREIYGMIDLKKVMSALKVEGYAEVKDALRQLYAEFSSEEQDSLKWIIRWLDQQGINYIHAEGSEEERISGCRYKRNWEER